MGTTELKLRKEAKARQKSLQRALVKDKISKVIYISKVILPALWEAIFDPTVRTVTLDIVRPDAKILENNVKENKNGTLKVSTKNYQLKAMYFEELFQWFN